MTYYGDTYLGTAESKREEIRLNLRGRNIYDVLEGIVSQIDRSGTTSHKIMGGARYFFNSLRTNHESLGLNENNITLNQLYHRKRKLAEDIIDKIGECIQFGFHY